MSMKSESVNVDTGIHQNLASMASRVRAQGSQKLLVTGRFPSRVQLRLDRQRGEPTWIRFFTTADPTNIHETSFFTSNSPSRTIGQGGCTAADRHVVGNGPNATKACHKAVFAQLPSNVRCVLALPSSSQYDYNT